MGCHICDYDIKDGEFYYKHSDNVLEICERCYRELLIDPEYSEEDRQKFTKFYKEDDD